MINGMKKLGFLAILFVGFNGFCQAPDYPNNPSFWLNAQNPTPIANLTPITLITAVPTPTGTPQQQVYYVTDFTATNSSASVPTDVQLMEGSTVKYQCGAGINSIPCTKTFSTPLRFLPNTAVSCRALTTSAAVTCSVQGYRAPK